MSKRIFSKDQIETLLHNENVAGCSEKSISYRKEFKVLAVRTYQEGLPPCEIFRQAGLPMAMIGHETPKNCLRRWRKVWKQKGETGLSQDGRSEHAPEGRPKNLANLTDKEKIERLEAEVAYLKEENRFLVKLRKERLNYGHVKSIASSDH